MTTTSQKAKGPAEAATSDRASSINPSKDQKMNDISNTTAPAGAAMPVDNRDLGDAYTIIHRARHLNELLFMAGESLHDREQRNAFTTGADMIEDLLTDAANIIDLVMSQNGGAA